MMQGETGTDIRGVSHAHTGTEKLHDSEFPSAPPKGLRDPTSEVLLRLTRALYDVLTFPLRLFLCFLKSGDPRLLSLIRTSFQLVSGLLGLRPAPAEPVPRPGFRRVHPFL